MSDTATAPPPPTHPWPAPTAGGGATATAMPASGEPGDATPDTGPPRSYGVARIRIVMLAVSYVAVGVASCAIFDRFEVGLVTAPLVPAVAAIVTVGRGPLWRLSTALTAIVVSTWLAIVLAGGGFGDIVDAVSSGFRGLLSTEWPSPARPELIGTVAASIAAAMAASAELARRRRFHLLPLLPLLVTLVAVIALSSPAGVAWAPLIVVGLGAAALALVPNDGTLRDRLVLLLGERRIVPLLLIVAVIVALASVPMSLDDRADPRQEDPPRRTAAILDPIEATLALRDLDPVVDLHHVVPTDGDPLPTRWRTTALENYNGDRWTPELTLRPIGRTLGVADGPTVDADVSFLDDDLSLVPLPGPPITVDADVETDVDRTIVRLVERPDVGDVVHIEAETTPSAGSAAAMGVATRLVDDDIATLTSFAEALAGSGPPADQLAALEAAMRDDFVLHSDVQGGGLQRVFIDRFLRDTQRGNVEQFVTGFVLLARSLGIDARVATGFVTPSNALDDGVLALRSADATVWPEVRLRDGTWVAYDPVPEQEATDVAPLPPAPQTQTPAAPQPPIAPPPDPDTDREPDDEAVTNESPDGLSTALTWAVRAVTWLGIVLAPFVVLAAAILGVKYRRRRRRLRAAAATDRIRGAWANATDVLVDAGMSISVSATDAEIATEGEALAADARKDLHRLASLSSAATFGSLGHADFLADDATRCLEHVEHSIESTRTRRQRLAWRLSLRSLRRSTRSPVTG